MSLFKVTEGEMSKLNEIKTTSDPLLDIVTKTPTALHHRQADLSKFTMSLIDFSCFMVI